MAIYKGDKKIAGLVRGEDISHATETHAGIIEIATQDEVNLGTDNTKAITPTKLKSIDNLSNYYKKTETYSKIETEFELAKKVDKATTVIYYEDTEDPDMQEVVTYAEYSAKMTEVDSAINSLDDAFSLVSNITKVEDYLYNYFCITPDYDFALNYFKGSPETPIGGCSSIRSGSMYGRNFDWLYDDVVSFVVKTPARDNIHEVVGVSGHLSALTKDFVESRLYNEAYRILPFYLTDGINDAGLVCNINVVPIAYGETTGTTPTAAQNDEICALMLPKFVLDRFDNAATAVDYLIKHVSVYVPDTLHQLGYEVHTMIADGTETYAIEFIYNQMVVTKVDNHPYMTNFHLHGVTPNMDGTVYTPGTQDDTHNAMITNGIEEFGSGLERYNIIAANIIGANTHSGMRSLLDKLTYTRTYNRAENPFWYTEYVGGANNVASAPSAFTAVVDEYISYYETRQRGDGKTWQTVHSAVYDIANKSMALRVQEGSSEYQYRFAYATTDELNRQTQAIDVKMEEIDNEVDGKISWPNAPGTENQVLGLGPGLEPQWVDPPKSGTSETWVFVMNDGTEVTKEVMLA